MPDYLDPELAKALFRRLVNPLKGMEGPVQDTPGAKPSTWKDEPVKYTLDSAMEALKGLTIGEDEKAGPSWRNGGALLGAAIPVVGGLKGGLIKAAGEEGPGLYSRLEKTFQNAAGKMHPNKAASLAKAGASSEEAQFRKLPELLKSKGDTPVTGPEVLSHLEQNPIDLSVKTLGKPENKLSYSVKIKAGEGDVRWQGHDQTLEDVARLKNTYTPDTGWIVDVEPVTRQVNGPTQYSAYKVPGGKNYQEHLIHYNPSHPQKEALDKLVQRRDELEQHPDFPNYLLEEDYNEFTPAQKTLVDEYNKVIEDINKIPNAPRFEAPHFGSDNRNLLVHSRSTDRVLANPAEGQSPSKGRFIEEVQSDWHQTGRDEGYKDPNWEAMLPTWKKQRDELSAEYRKLMGDLRNAEWAMEGPEATTLGDEALANGKQHYDNLLKERDSILRQQAEISEKLNEGWHKVPDAPFKDTYADLALKEQILDAVKDPDVEWIGHSTAEPHIERYGTERASWAPNMVENSDLINARKNYNNLQSSLKVYGQMLSKTDDPIVEGMRGKLQQEFIQLNDKASTLYDNIKQLEQQHQAPKQHGWQVLFEPQVGGRGEGIHDLGEEALRRRLIENASHTVTNPEDLKEANTFSEFDSDKLWKRIQMKPEGGEWMPRAEGMKTFYDKMLPAKLEKILKPFGGKVELQDVQGGSNVIPHSPNAPTFKAWVAKLTPEMKQRILKEGLPLMMALYAVYEKEMGGNAGPNN